MTDGEVANKLLGAWRYVGTRINGGNWDRGASPKGMIYYGAWRDGGGLPPTSNARAPER